MNNNDIQSLIAQAAQFNPIYAGAINQENQYVNSLTDQLNAQHQLALSQLGAQQNLALGSDPNAGYNSLMAQVAKPQEQQQGRLGFDYNTYANRENQGYNFTTQGLQQAQQLALQRLANDEQNQQQTLGYQRQQANQQGESSLNQRGLLGNGQTYANAGGLGGFARNEINQPFGIQQSNLTNTMNTERTGINQDYGLQGQQAAFQHQNSLADIATNARRGAQDQMNTYNFGVQGQNLNYNQQLAALQRQRSQLIAGDLGPSSQLYGMQKGISGYGS